MKRDKAIWITLLVLVSAIMLFVFLREDKEKFSWYKTFESSMVQPYDFGVFEALIQNEGEIKFTSVKESLNQYLDTNTVGQTYLFAGGICYLRASEIDSLLSFAKAGNQLVFITEGIPEQLLELALADEQVLLETYFQNTISLNLNQSISAQFNGRNLFQFRGFNKDTLANTNWNYLQFPKNNLFFEYIQPQYDVLGSVDSNVNFIRIYYGKGEIYVHTNPLLFSNYALKNERGFDYVNQCLNSIKLTNVIFDYSSRIYKKDTDVLMKQAATPLSFILNNPSLKWAWYLSLLSLLLFLLFVIKRKQRQIPVLEQKKNTTLGFIETLSALSFSHENSYQMAEQKMQLFLYFVRTKLGIATMDVKADEIKLIAKKSKVNEKIVERIFDYYFQVIDYKKEKTDNANLAELYNRINTFYKHYNNNQ